MFRRIRRAREETGLTQAQVAEFAGTQRSELADIEAGRRAPEPGLVSRIALLLGVDAAWLGGTGRRVARHRIDLESGLIDRAVRAHLFWRATIIADLDAKRVPVAHLADDDDHCDIHRWMTANAEALRRHPLHDELEDAHAETHRALKAVVYEAQTRRFVTALGLMRSGEPFWASLRLVSLLNRLRPEHADSGHLDGERTFPVWSSRYAIGHPLIDRQHEDLFRRTADIHMAVLRSEGNEAIHDMIGFLVAYAEQHFACEEAVFAQAGCANLEHHRQRHRSIATTVAHLDARLVAGVEIPLLELCWFLADWLSDHIINEDLPNAAAVHAAVAQGRISPADDARP